MSCQNCVNKVKNNLASLKGIDALEVQLDLPQLSLKSKDNISLDQLQRLLPQYTISTIAPSKVENSVEQGFFATYKPLLLIVSFIAGISILAQSPFDQFSWMIFMRYFMAGFFIVFAFFKFLDLPAFAESYAMYDIIAARWRTWGFIYPFVELGLGIAYLIHFSPTLTSIATIIILGISSIGVIQSNLDNRKIQCACLGTGFNLPMSVVTIIEDLAMIAMAIIMLLFT